MSLPHPRLLPARPDLAHAALRGRVAAARFVEPVRMRVAAASAPLLRAPGEPGGDAAGAPGLDSELLFGEALDVLDTAAGWAWGQAVADHYVGYVPEAALAPEGPAPTHRVRVRSTHLYPAPDIKRAPLAALSLGALVAVAEVGAAAGSTAGAARLATGGHAIAAHLAPLDPPEADWVAVAERLLGAPYLWGGRTAFGLDCSALVQIARQAAGHTCPRDSSMQEAALGADLAPEAALARGDLVFWRGHVGIMLDGERLLHANAHHMAVAAEPLAAVIRRIEAAGGGAPTRRARLDAPRPAR